MGNLADLSLGDIFQIVSLSRRSGTLQLTTSSESGEIVFDAGRVVAAFTTGEKESVGERMLAAGVVPPTAYQEMLAAQAGGTDGRALFEAFDFDASVLADALEEILKTTVYDMFEWDEGTFSFVLEDDPDPWRGFSLTGTRVVAQRGLSPQYLAIEGARIRDERAQADSLDAFLARDKPKSPPGLLTRKADVQTFAAQLAESSEPASEHDKVIPFPAERARREASTSQPAAVAPGPDEPPPGAVAVAAPAEAAPPPPAPESAPAQPVSAPIPEARPAVHAEAPVASPDVAQPALPQVEAPPPVGPVQQPSAVTSPAQPAVSSETETPRFRLLAIDDDPQVTRQLLAAFGARFAAVVTANTVADALTEIEAGPPGLVVASDLIIARSDGAGILGGIEILERVRERAPAVPVVLFTDYENAEAQQKAAKLGVSGFLMKPRKAQIQGAASSGGDVSPAMQAFVDELAGSLEPYLGPPRADVPSEEPAIEPIQVEPQGPFAAQPLEAPPPPVLPPAPPVASPAALPEPVSPVADEASVPADPAPPAGEQLAPGGDVVQPSTETALPYDLRREMAGLIEEVVVPGSEDLPPRHPDADGPVGTLRSMLAELVDPANRDTVTLLALRFASLVFERAALFLVTRRAFIGLGGFSVEESSDRFVVRVRRIHIPVGLDSVFARVVRYHAPLRGPLDQNEGNRSLVSGLGEVWPVSGAVAMPLVSNDRVAAILYGDNPSGRKLGRTDTLEIFLQQAGLAMDRVLLERKLEEARRRGTE